MAVRNEQPHVLCHAARESLHIVSALQHRHHPPSAALVRHLQRPLCHPSVVVISQLKLRERVSFVAIEPLTTTRRVSSTAGGWERGAWLVCAHARLYGGV